ncbi:MAG: BspA family leucine-rich repeat surface protein, partial [Prevotella sp.]|nr:BspA family leucine-rich repeat surface protein [Prevotella sp.]
GYFTAAGAEPWKDIDAVVLTGKNGNYWYDVTGSDPNGEEAIIFTIPEIPEEGMEWEFNILGTFIQNQLAFTTEDGQAIDNIIGDILFETKGNMVAIQDGKMLIYGSENEQGEIAMVDPYSGMIRIMGNEITLRLLNDPNTKFMALPLCVKAYYNNRDVAVKNGSFTVLVQSPKHVQEAEPYAVLSQNNTVLTFYYDDQKAARNGMSVGPFDYSYDGKNINASSTPIWYEQRASITNVVFDPSFANCTSITSTGLWFFGCSNMTAIEGINNLKTDNVTDMGFMFNGCSSLTSLDVSEFNTSNVWAFRGMFARCSSLTHLDVSHFDTSSAEDFRIMFDGCSSLTKLDVSNFNTTNVIGMGGMFELCSSLTKLDLSHFNTEKVFGMGWMFNGCSALTDLDISSFKTSSAGEMNAMFANCSSLTSLNLRHFDTSNVTLMGNMFYGCSYLISLNISNFNTSKVENYENMFAGCSNLASIQAGSANIPAEEYANIANPNLLVYVNEASLAPQGVQNVVINGEAKEIILTDVTEGNNNWNCPQAFTAEKISYTRNFKQQTEVGISRGWESIALPFTVQTITHETQGQIIPFGAQGTGKYFWLRGYSPEGLHRATVLEANTPYVISMPNNPTVYYAQYNLNGRVTFEAENTTVPATPNMRDMVVTRGNITMAPIFVQIQRDEMIYAVNVGQPYDRYPEGSVFVRKYRNVLPFEALTIHEAINGARPACIRIAAQPDYDVTGIVSVENGEWGMENGEWFGLDGRKLSGEPKTKGVYIQNGKKRIVK